MAASRSLQAAVEWGVRPFNATFSSQIKAASSRAGLHVCVIWPCEREVIRSRRCFYSSLDDRHWHYQDLTGRGLRHGCPRRKDRIKSKTCAYDWHSWSRCKPNSDSDIRDEAMRRKIGLQSASSNPWVCARQSQSRLLPGWPHRDRRSQSRGITLHRPT